MGASISGKDCTNETGIPDSPVKKITFLLFVKSPSPLLPSFPIIDARKFQPVSIDLDVSQVNWTHGTWRARRKLMLRILRRAVLYVPPGATSQPWYEGFLKTLIDESNLRDPRIVMSSTWQTGNLNTQGPLVLECSLHFESVIASSLQVATSHLDNVTSMRIDSLVERTFDRDTSIARSGEPSITITRSFGDADELVVATGQLGQLSKQTKRIKTST